MLYRQGSPLPTLERMKFIFTVIIISTTGLQATESKRLMTKKVGDQRLQYLLQSPAKDKVKPQSGWPLLLFLHGYGECGDDIKKVKKHGPPKLIGQFDSLANCVIISPQCPHNSWWRVETLKALVEEVLSHHSDIDARRLYVTGLSMGGYGIWSFLSHYPNYFAAAIPICGGGNPFHLPNNRPPTKSGIKNEFKPEGLKESENLPVWAFHGTKDRSVPIKETEILISLLREAGSTQVRFTSYPGAGHVEAWQKAYNNPKLWDWLFAKHRPTRKK